jgi:3-oxo-5-alpha-steroid 4-dehydrogenase 1
MEKTTFNTLVICWIAIACVTFMALMFVTAPYGRHSNRKWGIMVPDRLGWFMMEVPALLVFLYFIFTGKASFTLTVGLIALMYSAHYVNRSLIFPLRIRSKGKEMPAAIVLMAVTFNTINAGMLGYYTGTLQVSYDKDWLLDPRFITGTIIFLAGMIINITSDEKLIHLRKKSDYGYMIPYGGLFNYVSCPNFFGEIIEWTGYAILCWSLPSLSFLVWTMCNLIPRALDHHKWYKDHFTEYPQERKAVFPYLI